MKTASDILDYVGRENVASSLGLSRRRINEMAQMNEISALLYDALERMAGRPLPRDCFSFKAVANDMRVSK